MAALLSPILWRLNSPDRFDMYSTGITFLQLVFTPLQSDNGLAAFNKCAQPIQGQTAMFTVTTTSTSPLTDLAHPFSVSQAAGVGQLRSQGVADVAGEEGRPRLGRGLCHHGPGRWRSLGLCLLGEAGTTRLVSRLAEPISHKASLCDMCRITAVLIAMAVLAEFLSNFFLSALHTMHNA